MLQEAILDLLRNHGGLKAKEIARQLGVDRSQINALLYGPLKAQVVHDAEYQWWNLAENAPSLPTEPAEVELDPETQQEPRMSDLHKQLEKARKDLLELTTRTRLLNTPRRVSRLKTIEVVDELSDEVFRILVSEAKLMSFLRQDDEEAAPDHVVREDPFGTGYLFAQPEDDEELDENGLPARHTDNRLQTKMSSEALQRRLLSIFYDARSFEEEQGVNILYLALGFLRWFDAPSSDIARHAPLVLIPVELERSSVRSKFRIKYSGEDLFTNLSLEAKLKHDFGIGLPPLPPSDELQPSLYCEEVRRIVRAQSRWEVLADDIVLGFFSFAKFLMYRDLDPDNWPETDDLEGHPLLTGLLLEEGFRADEIGLPSEANIDKILDPRDTIHIMDADSSQALCIEEVRRGRNLVIQGPPGTGKSQTISNLIGAAVHEGKKVLFVAEKRAALDVVMRRMDNIGLAGICLELHSHKARKKDILADLNATLEAEGTVEIRRQLPESLKERRERLNRHAERMHTPIQPSGFTPYRILGYLVELRAEGFDPPDFDLLEASNWSKDDLRERERVLANLSEAVEEMGSPKQHPWRGVGLTSVLPMDVQRVAEQLHLLRSRFQGWRQIVESISELLSVPLSDRGEVDRKVRLVEALRAAPDLDRRAIGHSIWRKHLGSIAELLETGQSLAETEELLGGFFKEEAWDSNVEDIAKAVEDHGSSWFRFLNAEYRGAIQRLRELSALQPPQRKEERLSLLRNLMKAQELKEFLASQNEHGIQAFGQEWKGDESDWDALRAVFEWHQSTAALDVPSDWRQILSGLEKPERLYSLIDELTANYASLYTDVEDSFSQVELDLEIAFGVSSSIYISVDALDGRLEEWIESPDRIQEWLRYRVRSELARELGLDPLVSRFATGQLDPADAVSMMRYAYFEHLVREFANAHPEFSAFRGSNHSRVIAEFRDLDERRIDLARAEVALRHHEGMPRGTSGVGEVGIIRREHKKKRAQIPLRRLMALAGSAIQAIKPVFMMSPLSIAQYLEPGAMRFDLLLIDEASQVQPVDALGAIARCRQIVVVGDDKQLPPSPFFRRMMDEAIDENEDDPSTFSVGDLESILGLAASQGLGSRMLRWHYRSKHESLIAVSNREFYDDKLYVVPSAVAPPDLGLKYHHISDGVYDRGGSATNRAEARRVADAVIEHARQDPTRSLGVGTFSVRQRDAVLDEIEFRRREMPDLESFFKPAVAEPFFVKNLEAIQGDERDVILVSVGYGPDPSGYIAMNFGPLSAEGGERRLNVLITRARERCEVFSSMRSQDVDLARARGAGPKALKLFLHFAQLGVLDVAEPSERDYGSPFEEQVGRALERHGLNVVPQVGIAGFFVDLAIVDPENPGDYLLGIECDGASYHSARSARDRDRLREAVLRDRGWLLHRIWSTDWFHQPDVELRKALAAIEQARAMRSSSDHHSSEDVLDDAEESRDNTETDHIPPARAVHLSTPRSRARRYKQADVRAPAGLDFHQASLAKLAEIASEIVEAEGPVHGDEVARRLAAAFGLKRAGGKIQEKSKRALDNLMRRDVIARDGKFFHRSGQRTFPPRSREHVSSPTLRRPERLPPVEIRAAIAQVVSDHLGVSYDDAAIQVARMLGFKRTGGELRVVIRKQIKTMVGKDELRSEGGKLYK